MIKDNLKRCGWCPEDDELYIRYHDEEWGVPVHDDRVLFEFLILEGAQAGLSWSTILRKREGYRKNFCNFDPVKVSQLSDAELDDMLDDAGIVRNRLKVYSARKNAKVFLAIQEEWESFDAYLWNFTEGEVVKSHHASMQDMPTTTDASDAISKDLKKRGMSFVGSTIMYAYLQAVGVVDDHEKSCFKW